MANKDFMTGQWQCKRKSVTGTGHHLMMTLGAVSFTRSGVRCSDPSSWPQDEENKFPSTQPPDGTLLNSSWLTKTSWWGSGNVHESQSLATTGCWPWLLSPSHGAGCDAQTHLQWEMPGAWPVSLLAPPCSSPHPLVPTPVWLKLSQSALASRQHHERGGVPRPRVLAGSACVGQSLHVIIKHSWSSKTGYFDKDLPLNHLALANSTKIKQTLNDVVKDTFNWASSASWNGNNAPLNI